MELPPVVAPTSTTGLQNYSGWDETSDDEMSSKASTVEAQQRAENFDYTKKHIEEERRKIEALNFRANAGDGSRGRGRGMGRGRRGRDNACNQNQTGQRRQLNDDLQSSGRSVYGQMPDRRGADVDVFLKYDFSQRMFDTSKLVINEYRGRILANLRNHQIMTVEGFTGCGKTTQVPQFILDEAVENETSCRIAVTQPRRIAAISVANRVATERDWRLGGIVGYQVGMDKRLSEDTRLTYMTTGVLLQLLISRKSLKEWTHIIIDEVHERDLETDLLLLVIKKIMGDEYDKETKIILMSATLDKKKFDGYFPMWETPELSEKVSNVVVEARTHFPIKESYLEDVAPEAGYECFDFISTEEPRAHQECYEISTNLIQRLDFLEEEECRKLKAKAPVRGAVLVFLPGLLEIETMMKILAEVITAKISQGQPPEVKWTVLPLHSTITNEEQQRVFIPVGSGNRKIILATNIAESSITVPDIKYAVILPHITPACVWIGRPEISAFSEEADVEELQQELCTEWSRENFMYDMLKHCVIEKTHGPGFCIDNNLNQEASPEMLRSALESVVLQVKLLDMGQPEAVLALAVDPPQKLNIKRAVSNLKEIGALTILIDGNYNAYDGNLTFVGRVLSRLPIDIRLGRLILLGHAFDCLEETVIIATGLSVKSPFAYPYAKRLDAYLSKLDWSGNSFSDCIALLNTYREWQKRISQRDFASPADEKAWARNCFVQLISLKEMRVLGDELFKRLKHCGIELTPAAINRNSEEQMLLLKLIIAGAFYPNYFNWPRPNPKDYHKEIARELNARDPFTSVVFQGFPMEQPGDLYKKIIGKTVAYQSCLPILNFNGSRVVVTFDSRGNYIGPISTAVYRAVKLRQLRQIITFATPSREDAYNMVTERFRELESNKLVPCPEQVKMPKLKIRRIEACITHIESPREFFIVLKKEESATEKIQAMLRGNHLSLTTLRKPDCQPGQFCIVNYRGQNFRGRIDAERENYESLFIYLIDRGTSTWVRRQHVFAVNERLLKEGIQISPALAIKCRLRGIRPAMQTGNVWCREAMQLFTNYCAQSHNTVTVDIYSVVESVISCDIISEEARKDGSTLCDLLLEKKFADKFSESRESNENNMIRERLQDDTKGLVDHSEYQGHEEQQNKPFIPERMIDGPMLKNEPQSQASLRGPHSPLEITFNSLCFGAHLKQVVIDGSSTNSVTLDQDPYDSSSRMMVAANVAVSHRSGHILARETTVMPPIPGLCGLLAMLFCPKLEFRTDEDCTIYTGCVTGLGIDPSGECIFRDHDMEIVFDTQIDENDISTINSLRSGMSSILTEEMSNSNIRNLRRVMRNEAIGLLQRPRKAMVEEIWPEQVHQWNLLDPNNLEHKEPLAERHANAVFPPHRKVKLEKPISGREQGSNRGMYFLPNDKAHG